MVHGRRDGYVEIFVRYENGGTVIKAALYDLTGHEIAIASSKVEMNIPEPAIPNAMPRTCGKRMSGQLPGIQQSGIDAGDIAAVATTGHGNGLYLVGHDGNPAYPGIYSTDARAQRYVDRWYAGGTLIPCAS